ncbi:MAG TPA: penicillin-binding protein 1A, partial [Desulfobacteria bacterium]|nr:penicillin-binding protein 1A [Desulfobacteria bacterium]
RLITTLYKQNRVEVPVSQIPVETRNAFVAVEDARFYKHFGLDPLRIIGAAWKDLKAGETVEGGSTITQQTVKNIYLSSEKTIGRKLIEAWLAIQLERKYTKDEILGMYLNQIYFGQGAYGIEVASETYFGKPASRLNLAESAMLAGLPKAPNTYSPFQNWEGAKKRQKIVLNRMVETGYISQGEARKAEKQSIILKSAKKETGKAPYVVNEVIKYVTDNYENGAQMLFTKGLSIYTTIDLDMQKAAEEAFNDGLSGRNSLQGALVAVDPSNGHIRAMVGGRDYSRSKFNRATQARRQPGSAFKPFLYTAAIDRGYTEASTLTCGPVEFPQGTGTPYRPTDYGDSPYHNRPFILKKALAISDNVISVKLANEIGPSVLVDYANRIGIKSKLRPYLSLALGTSEVTPLEITNAYASIASGGIRSEPLLISKIEDKSKKTLEENKPKQHRVISPETAYIVTDMMTAVLQPGGTASSLAGIVGRPAAGKTGTTQNYRDAWFVGFTPELAAGVYVGYDEPKKSVGIPGGRIAGPIWANFIARALQNKTPVDFPIPPNIVKAQVTTDAGLLAAPMSTDTMTASFLRGTEPKEFPNPYNFFNPGFQERLPDGNPDTSPLPGDRPGQEFRRRIVDWFYRQ